MPTAPPYSIQPLGDRALVIELAGAVTAATAARARWLCDRILAAALPGVRDVVPAFCSLAVHYEPLSWVTAGAGPVD